MAIPNLGAATRLFAEVSISPSNKIIKKPRRKRNTTPSTVPHKNEIIMNKLYSQMMEHYERTVIPTVSGVPSGGHPVEVTLTEPVSGYSGSSSRPSSAGAKRRPGRGMAGRGTSGGHPAVAAPAIPSNVNAPESVSSRCPSFATAAPSVIPARRPVFGPASTLSGARNIQTSETPRLIIDVRGAVS